MANSKKRKDQKKDQKKDQRKLSNDEQNSSGDHVISSGESGEADSDALLKEFGIILNENLKEASYMNMDPFEIYVHKIKSSLHANEADFLSKLVSGYHALIRELNSGK